MVVVYVTRIPPKYFERFAQVVKRRDDGKGPSTILNKRRLRARGNAWSTRAEEERSDFFVIYRGRRTRKLRYFAVTYTLRNTEYLFIRT